MINNFNVDIRFCFFITGPEILMRLLLGLVPDETIVRGGELGLLIQYATFLPGGGA